MSDLLIRHGEWVVVCDGAKALVLENAGDAKFPNLKTVEVFEQKDLPTHELGTDKPGRATVRSAMAAARSSRPTGTIRRSSSFPRQARPAARRRVAAGKTKSLIVVAPPRALGMMRPAYSHALRGAVRAEIDKDLVKMPVHEIEKHLTA